MTDVCRDILDTGQWNPGQPSPVPPAGDDGNRCAGKPGAGKPDADAGKGHTCPKPGAGVGTAAGRTITDPEPATAMTPEADARETAGAPESPDAPESGGATEPDDIAASDDAPETAGAPECGATPEPGDSASSDEATSADAAAHDT